MTPEETAQKIREKAEAEKQLEANGIERRRQQAKKVVAAEHAAKRQPPTLVFDGEEDWRPAQWLIQDIVPAEGAGMLFGETDVGKTFLALNMAIPVCADLPWHGRAVEHGTVLFIEAEGGRSFALRKHAAKVEAGVTPNLLKSVAFVAAYEPLGFGPDADEALVLSRAVAIREAVANRSMPPIRFVVIDTLAQNISGDVDSNADMTAFLKLLRAFLKALSIESVFGLLIHHPGHANKDRGRGAYALPADLDLIMQLEGEQDALTLTCNRMRDGERFAPILLALEKRSVVMDAGHTTTTLVVVSRSDTETPKVDSHEKQILNHLRLHPRQTTAQIATDLRIQKAVVVKKVDALVADGTLCRVEVKGSTGQTKQLYEVVDDVPMHPDARSDLAKEIDAILSPADQKRIAMLREERAGEM